MDSSGCVIVAEGSTSVCTLTEHAGILMLRKTLKPEYVRQEKYRELLRKEVEVGRAIDCPYIIKYKKIELDEANCEMAALMDYVDGITLGDALRSKLEWFDNKHNVLKILHQILEGLQALHAHQVVHLDLNLDNIMLTNINCDVRIIDLGYCYSPAHPSPIGCSLQYCAPELLKNEKIIDARADVYAFGKIVQDMLKATGHNDYHDIREVAAKCCKDNPEHRYISAAEVDNALLMIEKKKRRFIMAGVVASATLLIFAGLSILVACMGNDDADELMAARDKGHEAPQVVVKTDTLLVEPDSGCPQTQVLIVEDEPTESCREKDFPFPIIVDSHNKMTVEIGASDDLASVPFTIRFKNSVDIRGYQLSFLLPDEKCFFIKRNEYAALKFKSKTKKPLDVLSLGAYEQGRMSVVGGSNMDFFKKGEGEEVVIYLDASCLEDGDYTVKVFDLIMSEGSDHPVHFNTPDFDLKMKVRNGMVVK